MSTQLQLRRGNTAQTAVFTGAIGEVTVDTDQKTLTVHDGVTLGGNYIVNKSQVDANLSIIQGINNSQNTTITAVNNFAASAYNTANGANGLAAGAYNQANTNAGAITLVQGTDATQNTRLNSIETINTNQNTRMSIIESVDNTQNTRLNSIETVNVDQNTAISIIQGVNLGQNTTITAVNNFAQAAYNTANNKFNSSGGTISGDVAVTGNLTVTGQTFYANVTNINVDDSFITLNANTVGSPVFDAGIEIDRGTANNVLLYWNEFSKTWDYTDDLQNDETIASQTYVGSSISSSITPVNQYAQSAYNQANSANSLAGTAYTTALGANGLAAGAFNKANTSLQNSGTQTLNGNLIINGSTNTTEWANTSNAYVSNKLYAGIAPQLSTPLPDLIAQFTGNVASYVQINAENIDPVGTADYVATADVGTDTSFYINLGIENSQAGEGAFYPLDGYLIVQGNTGQVGGNLIIGTTSQTPGQHTKIVAGGEEESNVVIQFNDDLSTIFYGNAIPSVTNSQYLGSSTKRWHSLYVGPGSVDIDNIVLSNNNGKLVISGASDIVISGSSVPSTGDISNKANNAYDRANAAFASSNAVNGYAQSAYATANGANGLAAGAFNTANGANGLAAGAFNTANGANGLAAGAYAQANTGTSIAEAAFAFANTLSGGSATDNVARTLAQSAYNSSNLVNQFAAGAFNTANGANGLAAGAFNQANTNAGAISIIQGVNLGQNTTITAVNNYAASAYATANSKFNSSGGTISGDVNVTGNLSVTGTTFYANTEQLHVKDNIITLNSNVTGVPTLDAGIEVNRGSETNTVLKWSETDHAWEFTNDGTNFFRIADTGRVNSAFALANTNAGAIAIIQGVNLGQNTTITAVNDFAAGAFNTANGANGLAAGAFNQANTNAGAIAIIQGVDLAQNTAITAVNNFAVSAYNQANTNAGAIAIIQGVDLAQNSAISIIQGVDLTQNTNITAVNNYAVSAFNTANGANGLAAGAYAQANTAYSYATGVEVIAQNAYNRANAAFASSNAVNQFAQSAFNTANGANGLAAGAYAQANTNAGAISIIEGVNSTQNTRINSIETININQNTSISIIQGVDLTQNTQIAGIQGVDLAQNSAISIIQGVDLAQNTNITAVNNYAASAFNTANGANGLAAGAFNTANGANGLAAGAYAQANTNAGAISIIQGVNLAQNNNITAVNNFAQSAYDTANGANGLAAGAYAAANSKFSSSGGTITGSVTVTNDLTVNGNVSFVGNVTSVTVTGNTGQFFGYAANGFNALYAGIPVGYLIEPQMVTQLSSDYDGYAGFNMQNINTGANSSSDYFITADNGSPLDGFLDLGLAGSNYSYEGYTLLGPNDGYLIVSGNTATGGGDLVFGTQLQNDIIFTVNGINTENEVARFTSANNLVIKSNNPSSSNSTGSLQVIGGVGVAGNVYADALYSGQTNILTYAQGVNTSQNTRMSIIEGVDLAQNSAISIIQSVDLTQNTNITAVNNYAVSAYAQANTNAGAIVIIQGVNSTQNTQIAGIQGVDLAQNSAISIIQGVDLTQNTNITSVNQYAASAYAQANNSLNLSTGGVVAGNVTVNSVIANNSIYSPVIHSPAAASKLELTDIGLVGITVASQTYYFGASGIESSQGLFGGSFGRNRLSLNNETNLSSTNYDTVKIQTGTDGNIQNEFTFANNTVTLPGAIIQTNAARTSNTFTTGSTSQVTVDSFSASTYRSAKYQVQITSGVGYHVIELRVVHNGTTTYLAQYGEIITDVSLGTFDADISGGNVRLLFTGANAVSVVKLVRDAINI
jgi:hypothetical protein